MKSFVLNHQRSILIGGLMLFVSSIGWAQSTSGATGVDQVDADGPSIRVIDNKGTIKYLQSNNGITTITSTNPGNLTTTTWQLGGTLTTDTYIDVDGNVFALDGIDLTTASASTNAVSGEVAQGGGATGTGYTLLVRNEATGAVEKLSVSDLLIGGSHIDNVLANQSTTYTITPTSGSLSDDLYNIFVFRNGAKLVHGIDYQLSTTANSLDILVDPSSPNGEVEALYAGDVIEIQWQN